MKEKLLMTLQLLVKIPKRSLGLLPLPAVPKSAFLKSVTLGFILLFAVSANAQLTETFESGIPASWAQLNDTPGLSSWTTSTDGYLSAGAAFMNPASDNVGEGNIARYYLISPLTTIPADGQLRFYTKQGDLINHGTQFEVRLSTSTQTDLSSFTVLLESYTEATLTTTSGYEEKVIDIPVDIIPGAQVYIAFVLVNTQTASTPTVDTWLVDNINLQTEVPCDEVAPADVTATNITPSAATLNWTHPTATQFEIQVLPVPQTPGPVGTPTDNSFDVTGLDPNTQYNVYIKTLCSSSGSDWSEPFSFTTLRLGTSCPFPIVIPDNGATYTLADNLSVFAHAGAPTYTTIGSDCFLQALLKTSLTEIKYSLAIRLQKMA